MKSRMTVPKLSSFLRLPLELRYEIYKHVEPTGPVTIGSEPRANFVNLDDPIPGLPFDHIPIVSKCFDEEILLSTYSNTPGLSDNVEHSSGTSSSNSCVDSHHDTSCCTSCFTYHASAIALRLDSIRSLRLTCRQIASELDPSESSTPKIRTSSEIALDLYLSFPLGVCVAVHLHPRLLRRARNIKVAGQHIFRNQPARLDRKRSHSWMSMDVKPATESAERQHKGTPGNLALDQNTALRRLVGMLVGHHRAPAAAKHIPRTPARLHRLHFRLFFPTLGTGAQAYDTYCSIWEEGTSPVPPILAGVYGGDIVLSCARGREVVGMEIVVRDNGGGARCVTGVWPRLEAGEGRWWVDGLEVGREGVDFGRLADGRGE